MAPTARELADRLGVAPGDIRVLMAQYPGDVPMWEEAGVRAPEVYHDISHGLSPYGALSALLASNLTPHLGGHASA